MYQKVIIVGNLGGDPELRYMPDGTAVTSFSVATNRKWTNKDGQAQEETVWFKVSAWRKLAEVCNQYLEKGRQVMVEGRLTADPDTGGPKVWTGNDGKPHATFELKALEVKFLASGSDHAGTQGKKESKPKHDNFQEEIPF